jgi:hypothetical protein
MPIPSTLPPHRKTRTPEENPVHDADMHISGYRKRSNRRYIKKLSKSKAQMSMIYRKTKGKLDREITDGNWRKLRGKGEILGVLYVNTILTLGFKIELAKECHLLVNSSNNTCWITSNHGERRNVLILSAGYSQYQCRKDLL